MARDCFRFRIVFDAANHNRNTPEQTAFFSDNLSNWREVQKIESDVREQNHNARGDIISFCSLVVQVLPDYLELFLVKLNDLRKAQPQAGIIKIKTNDLELEVSDNIDIDKLRSVMDIARDK